MKIINHVAKKDNINRAICIGYFDGLHLGHQLLVAKTIEVAKEKNLKPCLFTFTSSPKAFFAKKEDKYLTSNKDKEEIAKSLGIDEVIGLSFDKVTAGYSVEEFMDKVIRPLNAKYLICGFDFKFAKNGEGNAEVLKSLENDQFKVSVIDEVTIDNIKVSTTRICEELANGNIEKVNQLLGYNFTIRGKVIKGSGVGHKIGYPTINVDIKDYVLPKHGVYGVKVVVDNKEYLGMANVGLRPTINLSSSPTLEVNIFDFNDNIYDQDVSVTFLKFIREEKKFTSKEELVNAIKKDREAILFALND